MNNIKAFFTFILLVSLLTACTPQAATDLTPTPPESTQTSIPPTATSPSTPLPTQTPLPTEPPSPTPPSCAIPLSPADNATVPAQGPFDFTWSAFAGAASYVVSIGPADWYATNFPVNGTTLTRYMETFPSSPSYQWSVAALNASGQTLCTGGPYKFVTSKDLYATPSFAGNNSSGTTNVDNSSNTQQNGSSETSDTTSANELIVESLFLQRDSDENCTLGVMYWVKMSPEIISFKLLYGYSPDALDYSVDLTTVELEPYPAYNDWFAATPQLSLKNGDVVYFAEWMKFGSEGKVSERKGVPTGHTMTSCNP